MLSLGTYMFYSLIMVKSRFFLLFLLVNWEEEEEEKRVDIFTNSEILL